MSLKYLNLSGLEDLWINIKNYILSKIPTKTSELTNDSGYLTSHQSLSSCVKNVVTNNQTIKSTGITRGTAPSSAQTFGIAFSDNNNKYIGNIYGQYATDKSTYVGLYAYKGTTTLNGDNVSVRVGYDASGNAYTYAPTPATADNSTQIATTAFVKAQGYLTSHQSLANYVTIDTDQDITGNKNFKGILSTQPDATLWASTTKTTSDIISLGSSAVHVEQKPSGNLTDLSGGAWTVAEFGIGVLFFRINNGADIRYKNLAQNTVNRIPVVSNANRFINDVTPNANNTYSLGSSSLKWKNVYAVNFYENGTALSDKYAQVDIISANGIGTTRLLAYDAERYNVAGDAKPGSSLYDVSMKLHNSIGHYGDFSSGSGEFIVAINAHGTQSGTWKLLHTVSVDAPRDGARSFTIGMWVRIA